MSAPVPIPVGILRGNETRFPASIACRNLEAALAQAGLEATYNESVVGSLVARTLKRTGLLRRIGNGNGQAYVAACMWASPLRFVPQGLRSEIIPFIWDCWPGDYDRWLKLLANMKVRLAFVTSRQSADFLQSQLPGLETVWMPEAIDPARFDPSRPLAERSIDVIEYGRRWATYHDAITPGLASARKRHVFDAKRGQMTFATDADFAAGLSDAKLSVCFPSNVTHPEHYGAVETLTQRFLEGMAAGALVIGQCPTELEQLFGYNPIIPADMSDPGGQVLAILNDLASYDDLRQRNLKRVLEVGTWEARAKSIVAELEKRGYVTGK